MKRFLLFGLTALMAFSFIPAAIGADLGGVNNLYQQQFQPIYNPLYDMQQLQNQYRAEEYSVNEFKSFEEQKKANQERIQKDIERQQYLEERAVRTKSTKKFVNDNGVIKIESIY
ncbi:hypothetical protein J6S88_03905 [bacterium]|nr:hypothetical protein [bacterium]